MGGQAVTWNGHRPIIFDSRLDFSLAPDLVDQIDNAEVIIGDILDLATLIRTVQKHKIERIIHLAALMPGAAQANPAVGLNVNCFGTVNVLEAARIAGVQRVVFSSSKAAFSPVANEYAYPEYRPLQESYPSYPEGPIVVYGASKIASELMGAVYDADFGVEFVALRFATIYSIGKSPRHGSIAIHTRMIENAMVGSPTVVPTGGDEKDDMIYVKDCANALVLACLAKNVKHRVFQYW